MGKKKEHQNRLLELAKEIISLGGAIKEMEKDMESTWIDDIERQDLQSLKERMRAVENALCTLQGEIEHLEELHCKSI
jgi:hypothetical protein